MSDTPQGPGWWRASDGNWYPPQTLSGPAPVPPAFEPPTSPGVDPPSKASVANAALGLSIASFVCCPLVAAVVALVFARRPDARRTASDQTKATIARVLSIVNIIMVILLVVATLISGGTSGDKAKLASKAAATTTTVGQATTPVEATASTLQSTTTVPPTTSPPTTPAPTTVPPTSAPPPTQSIEANVFAKVSKALGNSNRKASPRVTVVVPMPGQMIQVKWAINDNLTEGLTKDGARLEGVKMLRAIQSMGGLAYTDVNLEGTYPLVDQFGNGSEQTVIQARYSRATMDKFNFNNFDFKKVYEAYVADSVMVHPTFRY